MLFFDLPKCKSLSLYDNTCYIGLDKSLTANDQKEMLSHELGHCEYGGFYNRYSLFDVRQKAEHRASIWSYSHLTPLDEIIDAIRCGFNSLWDLAEFFDVSCEFMAKALDYYIDACGINFNCA